MHRALRPQLHPHAARIQLPPQLDGDRTALQNVLVALSHSSRDTDTKGWYKQGSTIGVIFTELGADADGRAVAAALLTKVTKALTASLTISQINTTRQSFATGFPWAGSYGQSGVPSFFRE